jgi:hypothetical protein
MSVGLYSVFMHVATLRRADPPSKETYRLCERSRNRKSDHGPTEGCRATDRWTDTYGYKWISRILGSHAGSYEGF